MKLFELTDYGAVIRAADTAGLDLVLVGGQAVSLYAGRHFSTCAELARFQPFVSKDADLLGTLDDGSRLARALNTQWEQNPRKGGMRGLSLGKLTLPNPPNPVVEILGRILGADAAEVRATSIHAELPGIGRLRVIQSAPNLAEKRLPVFFEQQLPAAMGKASERTLEKIRAGLQAAGVKG